MATFSALLNARHKKFRFQIIRFGICVATLLSLRSLFYFFPHFFFASCHTWFILLVGLKILIFPHWLFGIFSRIFHTHFPLHFHAPRTRLWLWLCVSVGVSLCSRRCCKELHLIPNQYQLMVSRRLTDWLNDKPTGVQSDTNEAQTENKRLVTREVKYTPCGTRMHGYTDTRMYGYTDTRRSSSSRLSSFDFLLPPALTHHTYTYTSVLSCGPAHLTAPHESFQP